MMVQSISICAIFLASLLFADDGKIFHVSIDGTIDILKGVRPRYEEHHGLKITDDAVRAAAELAERYLSFWFKKYTKYKEQPY